MYMHIVYTFTYEYLRIQNLMNEISTCMYTYFSFVHYINIEKISMVILDCLPRTIRTTNREKDHVAIYNLIIPTFPQDNCY